MRKILKAGVYDRWLYSLGGGEQLAFAYALALRDLGYQTELLTHKKVDLVVAEKKMNVNLHGIELKYLPNMLDYQLSQYTENYDVFICNSYLDYIPNRSKFGILSIFFPSRIHLSVYEYFKRALVVPSLRKFFIYPSRFEGFRYDESVGKKIFKWLGKKSTIVFNQDIRDFHIELHFGYFAFSLIDSISFSLDKEVVVPLSRSADLNNNCVSYSFKFTKPTKGFGLSIYLPDLEFSEDVALTKILILNYRYFFYNIFKKFFPKWEMRLHGGPSVTKFSDIKSYDRILTISKFSRKWIEKYWHVSSDILYPPASINSFSPSKDKKNIIVNIGRFFVTGHCKKQLDMVRVFKKLVDSGRKDWELHFIGSVAEGDLHRKYFETTEEESLGYPIFFYNNATFAELREILSKAKIYWHATGLDENPENNPIRLEHFGITTIEAMASGCVPVVINLGGQSEIVTSGAGFLWNNRDELLLYTKKLINNPKLIKEMSLKAIERSKFFDIENFKRELKKYLPL